MTLTTLTKCHFVRPSSNLSSNYWLIFLTSCFFSRTKKKRFKNNNTKSCQSYVIYKKSLSKKTIISNLTKKKSLI